MALIDYPMWVLKFKEHNKEIRLLQGKYYLYQVHTSRIDGKVKKVTDKYLGRITEEGLIPPTKKQVTYTIKEYHTAVFAFSICSSIITGIIKKYPRKYLDYLPLCFYDVFFNQQMDQWNRSYLSVLFPNLKLISRSMAVQNEINRLSTMFKHPITKFLSGSTLDAFFQSINDLYMVGIGDSWTLAKVSEETIKILNEHHISLELPYGESK